MPHPWFDAQGVSTFVIPIARNPNRRECWIGAAGDNLNPGEETVEDVHSARRDKDGDEDDTILSHTVIEQDADGHNSRRTRYYLCSFAVTSELETRAEREGWTNLSIEQEHPSLLSTIAFAN